jgi:hypothetical protein
MQESPPLSITDRLWNISDKIGHAIPESTDETPIRMVLVLERSLGVTIPLANTTLIQRVLHLECEVGIRQ